jgi:hypothetical protein
MGFPLKKTLTYLMVILWTEGLFLLKSYSPFSHLNAYIQEVLAMITNPISIRYTCGFDSSDIIVVDEFSMPSAMYLARGNHESKSMNKIYGFEGEVKSKLNDTFVELFAEVFCCLPLGHVINNNVFVVHGGLFSVDGVKLSDIRAIDRFREPPEEGILVYYLFLTFLFLSGATVSVRLLFYCWTYP